RFRAFRLHLPGNRSASRPCGRRTGTVNPHEVIDFITCLLDLSLCKRRLRQGLVEVIENEHLHFRLRSTVLSPLWHGVRPELATTVAILCSPASNDWRRGGERSRPGRACNSRWKL